MKNLLLLASFLLMISTNISAQMKNDRIAAEIRKVMDAQAAGWNAGDIEAYMRGYWNSEKLVFISGDTVTKGYQPTLERYKKRYDTKAKMGTLQFSDLEIEVLSKDAAKVLGSWSLQREKDNPKGKFTLIFRKFKDGWKIVHDHTS
jgi:ketosteroid isomerase-like protein